MYYARLLIAVIVALSTGMARSAESVSFVTAMVTHVTDGDTLWVHVPEGRPERLKLRLAQLDAPEICQAGGPASKALLERLVLHRWVEVRTVAIDDYGRSIARVEIERQDLGSVLVEAGLAWSSGYRGRKGRYWKEEQRARAARRGVFADLEPVEPRAFRRLHGPCATHAEH